MIQNNTSKMKEKSRNAKNKHRNTGLQTHSNVTKGGFNLKVI